MRAAGLVRVAARATAVGDVGMTRSLLRRDVERMFRGGATGDEFGANIAIAPELPPNSATRTPTPPGLSGSYSIAIIWRAIMRPARLAPIVDACGP
ncbi:hypothetical protein GCM10009747_15200 [Agromyces humatus]|uniref:Uncharacterized protein n=1 Tax=Agromyces humatus TaxID=279573 RepID=A0ABN2KJ35_9MICO